MGKTYIVRELGKKYFNGSFHQFNFEKNPELNRIFDSNLDSRRILAELELEVNSRIVPGKDLVFFDEVQDCPKAIMSLRYFFEENPELHIIAAGSLIEFSLQEISFPVGRVHTMNMHPMSFSEFLIATGKSLLAENLATKHDPFSEPIINKLNTELSNYFVVGGMPECVKTFRDTNSFKEVTLLQSDLITTFRQDFSKYSGKADKRCLNQVLNSLSGKIGNQIIYSHLSKEFTQPTIKKAFDLLSTARLFYKIKSASPDGIPLNNYISSKRFKTIFLDIGLLSCLNGYYKSDSRSDPYLNPGFRGMMAEQFIGQELLALLDTEIFYWSREARGSSAETDFLIQYDDTILPIEVKSGKSGRLTSLHLLMNSYPNLKKSNVFTKDKYGTLKNPTIEFLPLFEIASFSK